MKIEVNVSNDEVVIAAMMIKKIKITLHFKRITNRTVQQINLHVMVKSWTMAIDVHQHGLHNNL